MKKILSILMILAMIISVVQLPADEAHALDDRVEAAIAWAVAIANDDSHGYSQSSRLGPEYDCSSFICTAFKQGGFNINPALTTRTMINAFKSVGFTQYAKDEVVLKRGDIMITPNKHCEIYLGNNQCVAAHDDFDNKPGDTNNQEINVKSKDVCKACKIDDYQYVLRYEGGGASKNIDVAYRAHVQSFGWQNYVDAAAVSGTNGEYKRLEAVSIKLINQDVSGDIEYRSYVQSNGWERVWARNGEISGTVGQAKRVEAIEIRLRGKMAEKYDVYYRVHAETFGWLGWTKNGTPAGTLGLAKRVEAFQVMLVPKDSGAPGDTANPCIEDVQDVFYRSHVQSNGWLDWSANGAVSGTTGEQKRLEGIEIKLGNLKTFGEIEYRAHVQSYGWEKSWSRNGEMSGTSGEHKRIEAVEVRLTGDLANNFDVYYRVHVQSYGWLGWTKNGEPAGTVGKALRVEAIQVKIVRRGENPPGSTSNSYIEN